MKPCSAKPWRTRASHASFLGLKAQATSAPARRASPALLSGVEPVKADLAPGMFERGRHAADPTHTPAKRAPVDRPPISAAGIRVSTR